MSPLLLFLFSSDESEKSPRGDGGGGEGKVPLKIFGGGVWLSSLNPDLIES